MPRHRGGPLKMLTRRAGMRQAGWVVVLALAALLFLFGNQFLGLTIDWLWFGEVGQRPVFWTILAAQAQLALLFGVAFFLLAFLNVWLARRATPALTPHYDDFPIRVRVGRVARVGLSLLLLGGSLAAGILAGLEAAGHWDEYLRFLHPVPFGRLDPIFGQDLGFFVFRFPFLLYLYRWLFLSLLLVTAATALVYYLDRAVEVLQGYTHVAGSVRAHLSLLLGLLALVKAWGYRLDAYGLLYAVNGGFIGAGYTDLHARLVALNLLTFLALIAALGFLLNAYLRLLWLPAAALGLMLLASLLIGSVYPGIVQRFTVQPNELAIERPYIQRHLDLTRSAYGLDQVLVSSFGSTASLKPANVQHNQATIQNIRLWDYRPLGQTYQQLQSLKPYYTFPGVDIDRYRVGGQSRQVMLAARELQQNGLPAAARRWVNEWLEYTHGYGFVMSPVNEVGSQGAPVFWAGGAPQRSPAELPIARPQIYFGEATAEPVIAPSRTNEFSYPAGTQAVRTRYAGSGGVPLEGWLRRVLFATYFGETNILISNAVTPESRILFNRKVDERAARVAPFLAYDSDPFLVIADGRLFWMQDAYTTSGFFPYSLPAHGEARNLRRWGMAGLETDEGDFNYIRNSIKIVTDAYDGRISFYVADPSDPIIRAYQAAFPSLFLPLTAMPPALQAHIRYPEGLFTVQAGLYTNYHVTDPALFFTQSDKWQFPRERVTLDTTPPPPPLEMPGALVPAAPTVPEQLMEPFYVTMRLPDGQDEEFVLMLPFQIEKPPSMPAWLCARCDGRNYGRLRAYTFPQGVDGPTQVESFIDQNADISGRLSLWNQHGSRVLRGNLLALPMDRSVLYVKPIYLAAEVNSVPRLTRVILVSEGQVVMARSLGQALAALVRGESGEVADEAPSVGPKPSPRPSPAPATSGPATVKNLVDQANRAFEAATAAQQQGDWARYGQELKRLQETLRTLQQRTGVPR
jgi:uncharacterized membrane protein (UPF0182 family)